jgi:hypothetical protein
MASSPLGRVYLVRVTTDDRKHLLYATAGAREDAVNQVLNAIPEGWSASLLPNRVSPVEVAALNLMPGDVRELT